MKLANTAGLSSAPESQAASQPDLRVAAPEQVPGFSIALEPRRSAGWRSTGEEDDGLARPPGVSEREPAGEILSEAKDCFPLYGFVKPSTISIAA